jgi:hypothetical protein
LRNAPIRLSDGRQIGILLSTGRAPDDLTLDGVRYPRFQTTVAEVLWANPGIAALAKKARIDISDQGVTLLGTGSPRIEKAAPLRPSGWGQRLVAGQRIEFS